MRLPPFSRKLAGAVKLAALLGHQTLAAVGRLTGWSGPAEVAVGQEGFHRTEGFWLSALTDAATARVPPRRLLRLARELDLAAYLRVLSRCRAGSGPHTVWVAGGSEPQPPAGATSIRLRYDYYDPKPGGPRLDCPYPLHPWFYMTGAVQRLARLRAAPRRFRLVFAGARSYNAVGRQWFRFPLLHRNEIVARLAERFADRALVVTRPDQVPEIARTDRTIVLVLHPAGPPGGLPEPLLPPTEYVRLLASAECALCPPGLMMPHAHNLIEAMAVGTIPVTNYAGWCRPTLTPGENCLGFDTLDELDAAVEYALVAPAAETDRLRAGVCSMYDERLSPAGFSRRFKSFVAGDEPGRTLAVNVERHTADLWAAGQAARGSEP